MRIYGVTAIENENKIDKWEILLIKVIELVLVKDLINVRQSLTTHITITDS